MDKDITIIDLDFDWLDQQLRELEAIELFMDKVMKDWKSQVDSQNQLNQILGIET